jgi:ferredoxin
MRKRLEKFIEVFQLPPAMVPHVDLVATDQEMELVVGLEDQDLTPEQVAEKMRISGEEAGALLRRAFKRDLVKRETRDGATTYSPGTFYANLDYWTTVETGTWRRLPAPARKAVGEWQVLEFIKLWMPAIEQVTRDPGAWVRMKNRDILLLEEAMELVEAAEHTCLLPCACQTTLMPDSPVVEGSIRVGERARLTLEQGQGRSLSVEEAKAHLLALDRMGLVHTGLRGWRMHDPGLEWMSHGNCHPAYSFPFIAGARLGLEKVYPRVHYLAELDWDRCTHCGVCIGRCPFGALYHDGATVTLHGERIRQVVFEPENCWGCGLCANTCPEEAIRMEGI